MTIPPAVLLGRIEKDAEASVIMSGEGSAMQGVTETIRRTAIFFLGLGALAGAFMAAMRLIG